MDYKDTLAALRQEIGKCDLKISQTEANKKKEEELKSNYRIYSTVQKQLTAVMQIMKLACADLTEYTTQRRAESTNAIQMALMHAGNIVPSSNAGIKFKMENGAAWFETTDGLSLDRTEGSGYKSTLSMFMRHVFLTANPAFLQSLILDEVFAKLSPERSAVLSTYLSLLGQNMQIISIEQKPEVFADCDCVSYQFSCEDGTTILRRS